MKKAELMRRQYGVHTIYLATDSTDVVEKVRREYTNWTWLVAPKASTGRAELTHVDKELFNFHFSNLHAVSYGAFLDLFLLAEANMFVMSSSQYSAVARLLSFGQGLIPPACIMWNFDQPWVQSPCDVLEGNPSERANLQPARNICSTSDNGYNIVGQPHDLESFFTHYLGVCYENMASCQINKTQWAVDVAQWQHAEAEQENRNSSR
jgi:hypothetical protein